VLDQPKTNSNGITTYATEMTLPINDDGVITTVSSQNNQLPDQTDRCSSIMSLSDKYRNQEEIEIFQENYHYKPPPQPIRPTTNTSQLPSAATAFNAKNAKDNYNSLSKKKKNECPVTNEDEEEEEDSSNTKHKEDSDSSNNETATTNLTGK
jgi:hypothetical protein